MKAEKNEEGFLKGFFKMHKRIKTRKLEPKHRKRLKKIEKKKRDKARDKHTSIDKRDHVKLYE